MREYNYTIWNATAYATPEYIFFEDDKQLPAGEQRWIKREIAESAQSAEVERPLLFHSLDTAVMSHTVTNPPYIERMEPSTRSPCRGFTQMIMGQNEFCAVAHDRHGVAEGDDINMNNEGNFLV